MGVKVRAWFNNNDMNILAEGLEIGGVALDGTATVEATLRTRGDADADPPVVPVDVPGQTWPLALDFIVGSAGDFVGVGLDTLTTEPGDELEIYLTADDGPDRHGEWQIDVLVEIRKS